VTQSSQNRVWHPAKPQVHGQAEMGRRTGTGVCRPDLAPDGDLELTAADHARPLLRKKRCQSQMHSELPAHHVQY